MIQGDIDAVPDGGLDLGGPLNVSTATGQHGVLDHPFRGGHPAFGSSFNNNGWVAVELGTFFFHGYTIVPQAGLRPNSPPHRRVVNSGSAQFHTFLADSIDRPSNGLSGSDVLAAVEIGRFWNSRSTAVVAPAGKPLPRCWPRRRTPDPHPSGANDPSDSSSIVVLTEYTPAPMSFNPGIAEMEPLVQGEEQIKDQLS